MRDYDRRESGLLVPKARVLVGGHYIAKLIRAIDGSIDEFEFDNIITNQGLDHILGVEFTGVAQITAWFIAPFTNNYVPIATDTAATIVGNAGEATNYPGGARLAYTGVESAQQVTNQAAPATFTFNANATIYGAFLSSASAVGATTGVLFSAAQFSAAKTVTTGDQLLLTYVVGAASA